MPFNPLDLIGPGTLKFGSKTLESLGVPCHGLTEVLEEITSSPAYTKHRIDNAADKIQDFWDDHKEDVSDFIDNVSETISDGWNSITPTIPDNADDILDGIGSLFGSLLS